ncbi:unnamed protein product [Lampetra planeri]
MLPIDEIELGVQQRRRRRGSCKYPEGVGVKETRACGGECESHYACRTAVRAVDRGPRGERVIIEVQAAEYEYARLDTKLSAVSQPAPSLAAGKPPAAAAARGALQRPRRWRWATRER